MYCDRHDGLPPSERCGKHAGHRGGCASLICSEHDVTLTDPADAYMFRTGDLITCLMGMEPPPRASWPCRLLRRITWWRQTRYEVVEADVAVGKLGIARLRWSWRQWRWERA